MKRMRCAASATISGIFAYVAIVYTLERIRTAGFNAFQWPVETILVILALAAGVIICAYLTFVSIIAFVWHCQNRTGTRRSLPLLLQRCTPSLVKGLLGLSAGSALVFSMAIPAHAQNASMHIQSSDCATQKVASALQHAPPPRDCPQEFANSVGHVAAPAANNVVDQAQDTTPAPSPTPSTQTLAQQLQLASAKENGQVQTGAEVQQPEATASTTTTHVVKPGETLWSIAASYQALGTPVHSWQEWYAQNKSIIGTDPNLIYAGTVLSITHAVSTESAVAS